MNGKRVKLFKTIARTSCMFEFSGATLDAKIAKFERLRLEATEFLAVALLFCY